MEIAKLKNILEAVLLGADRTLTVAHMENLFELDEERPTRDEIRQALHEMADDYASRGYELKQVASGFRLQVKQEYATWVGRLWEEKPARYTRALLETMSLIAYRQPITRGEIEEVRGVSVSSNIVKTLMERDWIKVLGHKDVPGKPTLYGTTKGFLDYFNLKTLDELPTLAEIKDLDSIHPELELDDDAKTDGALGAPEVAALDASEQTEPENVSDERQADDLDGETALASETEVLMDEVVPEEELTDETVCEDELETVMEAVFTDTHENAQAAMSATDEENESEIVTENDDIEPQDETVKKAFNV